MLRVSSPVFCGWCADGGISIPDPRSSMDSGWDSRPVHVRIVVAVAAVESSRWSDRIGTAVWACGAGFKSFFVESMMAPSGSYSIESRFFNV